MQTTDVNLEALQEVGAGIASTTLGAFEMVGAEAFNILTTEVWLQHSFSFAHVECRLDLKTSPKLSLSSSQTLEMRNLPSR